VIVALNGSRDAQPMPDVGARGETLFVSGGGGEVNGEGVAAIPALGARVLRVR
jgi:hypothetical protein